MKLSPTHLKRYVDVARIFYKHAHSDIIKQGEFDAHLSDAEKEGKAEAEDLAADLEKLGPTFVKIGQLLSTRGDLLPPVYLEALSRLQDDVDPLPYEEVDRVVATELGVKISKAFTDFSETPLGSASLGQVHLATLHSGRKVAVKVQRPGIRAKIVEDLDSLKEIAKFLDQHTEFGRRYEIGRIVGQFRTSLMRELDYHKEARHLSELRENLAKFQRLHIPGVVEDYSTSKVLTMDYLAGTKITALSGAVLADLDGEVLAEEIFRAYLQQILVDGFFHADPHPGNLLLTPEHDIAILDLGMIGRMNERIRDQLLHLLAGISDGNGVQTAEAAIKMGEQREKPIDRQGFINSIEDIVGTAKTRSVGEMETGALVLEVMQACAEAGIRIPGEISLLGKTLMNLDRVGIALSRDFSPNDSIRRHLSEITSSRMKETLTSANLMAVLTEAKEFFGQLPSRLNRIIELVADNKMRVKVDTIDELVLIKGLQKVANRITTGLILAAFIVGSTMLARVETDFKILGYPGLSMVFFLIAVIGSIFLMIQIYFKDD